MALAGHHQPNMDRHSDASRSEAIRRELEKDVLYYEVYHPVYVMAKFRQLYRPVSSPCLSLFPSIFQGEDDGDILSC